MIPSGVDELAHEIVGTKDLAVFCGAGISRNSGFPLAKELVCQLLLELGADAESISEISRVGLPFEVLMDTFVGDHHFDSVFEIFRGGEPNLTHHVIAALSMQGYCKTIATTNFDLLLEDALDLQQVNYRRLITEKEFAETALTETDLKVVKLHGSVDFYESLRATLREIAEGRLATRRRHLIKDLFSNGTHERVLVLGYSCSDVFDIVPELKSLSGTRHEVILIDHVDSVSYSSQMLTDIENTHAFYGYAGRRVRCDTDILVRHIGSILQLDIPRLSSVRISPDWRERLARWRSAVNRESDLGPLILGWILEKHARHHEAIASYRESLRRLGVTRELRSQVATFDEVICLLNLGRCLRAVGNSSEAVQLFEAACRATSEIDNGSDMQIKACAMLGMTGLAETLIDQGHLVRAEETARRAVTASQTLPEPSLKAWASLRLGQILTLQKRYAEALKCYKRVRSLLQYSGLVAAMQQCDSLEGFTRYQMGERDRGLQLLEEAVRTAHILSHWQLEFESRMTIGWLYLQSDDWAEAIRSFAPALALGPADAEKRKRVHICVGLALAYHGLGNDDKELKWVAAAHAIGIEYWSMTEESIGLLLRAALSWVKSDDEFQAASALEGCIEMAAGLALSESIVECKVAVGDAYSRKGLWRKALAIYQDALQAASADTVQGRLLCLVRIAQTCEYGGQHKQALTALGSAIALAQYLGDNEALKECQRIMRRLENASVP